MFVRTSKTPNSPRAAVKVVENIREGHKVKQIVLQHIGIAHNDSEIERMKLIGEEFIAAEQLRREKASGQLSLFPEESVDARLSKMQLNKALKAAKAKRQRACVETTKVLNEDEGPVLGSLREVSRSIDGIHEIFGSVFDRMNLSSFIKNKKDQQLLRDLVLMRIAQPCSKYKTQTILQRDYYACHDLNRIYRLMDKIHPEIPNLKEAVFLATQKLQCGEVNILFYDCTTLYFESTDEDDLRRFGYSKDHRFNTTQVVLALATDQDGLPVGYELFAGNTAEVKTLIASIENWSQFFKINSVCFVADRAMMSEKNLKMLEEKGYSYIVAAKLRSLTASLKAEILDRKNYAGHQIDDELNRIGTFDYHNRRIIASYKPSRASHDKKCRENILEKIKKKLEHQNTTKNLINNQGIKKFTKMDSGKAALDEEKIAADALWDGMHGVITNIKDQNPIDILKRYHQLWKIEECFRINKTNLAIRPIFHFKPKRIEAHIAICYLAFATLRHTEYQVNLVQKISPQQLISELLTVQSSILLDTKTQQRYLLPSKMSHTATRIYRAFHLKRQTKPSKLNQP